MKHYSELILIPSFKERVEYLSLNSKIGEETFGYDRYINQKLYTSAEWKKVRNEIILRDKGCNLGMPNYEILDSIIVHHINPISKEQLLRHDPMIFSEDNLVCASVATHNLIHYGHVTKSVIDKELNFSREPKDTILW